jgi:hypothetical protein
MSTYSPNLRIELIDSGTQAGVWGSTTNTNLGTLIEQSISGYVSVSITAASQALTAVNGATDQSRMAMVNLTTTTVAAFSVFVPPSPKQYTFKNSSGYTATIYGSTVLGNTTAAGTGIVVPNGAIVSVWSDGTNIALQNQNSVTPTAGTNNTQVATTAFVATSFAPLASPTFTGIPLAPTAAVTVNTTQLATTAFVHSVLPKGTILLWSGAQAAIPTGWTLCDGTLSTPNLRDRFVVGAGTTYAVAATGGSANAIVVSHQHTYSSTTGGQSADHSHGYTGSQADNGDPGTFVLTTTTQNWGTVTSSGTSNGHTHAVSGTTDAAGAAGTNANLPPYYALCYIMKTSG